MDKSCFSDQNVFEKQLFYAIGNSVGIPCCIKKPCRAGLHCGGKVDVAEATRRRRRILPSRILFYKYPPEKK